MYTRLNLRTLPYYETEISVDQKQIAKNKKIFSLNHKISAGRKIVIKNPDGSIFDPPQIEKTERDAMALKKTK
jgi:hypothetical protein